MLKPHFPYRLLRTMDNAKLRGKMVTFLQYRENFAGNWAVCDVGGEEWLIRPHCLYPI